MNNFVNLAQKLNRLDILIAAVFIGQPFTIFPAKIKI